MNVLSLFDGIGCGLQALKNIGIIPDIYYRSEIDKYADKIFWENHKDVNVVDLGDVKNIKKEDIKHSIDLLMGGSPCQNFSFAGKQQGMVTKEKIEIFSLNHYLELKEKGFQFEGQSYLFWEYVRILKEIKPKYFLLENVVMAKKWQNIITNVLQTEPILLDSGYFSAQRRKRLYWTNIPVSLEKIPKNYEKYKLKDVLDKNEEWKPLAPFAYKKFGKINYERFNWVNNLKSNTLTTNRTHTTNYLLNDTKNKMRLLTRREWERLQTLPEGYTDCVPVTYACKCIGNGWNVKTIEFLLKNLK
jgi:DNA-cytosine methyltransferase